MTKLYELSHQMIGLKSLMESDEHSFEPETLADTLDGLEGDLAVKAESLLSYVSNLGSDVNAIDVEIKRLTARKKTIKNRQDSLREYLRSNMELSQIDKITCPLFSITLRKATEVVSIDVEPDQLPECYRRVTVVADKTAIKNDLKQGISIVGCSLQEGKRALMIK